MPLSRQAIEEFREIWKRNCGEDISYEAAEIEARNMLVFARWLLRDPNVRLSTDGRLTDGAGRSDNEDEDS